MKIAVCISGQPRTINQCLDSLIKFILEPLNADVFFYFWADSKVPDYMSSWYGQEVEWPKLDVQTIVDKLKPKAWLVEEQKSFDVSAFKEIFLSDPGRMQAVNFQHLPSMLYSVYMANLLKTRYELLNDIRYDLVLRIRPDMKFFDYIPDICLEDTSKIYYFQENCFGGINDRWAAGPSDKMNIYAECFHNLTTLFNNGVNFHPETVIRRHLEFNNIDFCGISTIGDLVR